MTTWKKSQYNENNQNGEGLSSDQLTHKIPKKRSNNPVTRLYDMLACNGWKKKSFLGLSKLQWAVIIGSVIAILIITIPTTLLIGPASPIVGGILSSIVSIVDISIIVVTFTGGASSKFSENNNESDIQAEQTQQLSQKDIPNVVKEKTDQQSFIKDSQNKLQNRGIRTKFITK